MAYRRRRRYYRRRRSSNSTLKWLRLSGNSFHTMNSNQTVLALDFKGAAGYVTQVRNMDIKMRAMIHEAGNPGMFSWGLSYDLCKIDEELTDDQVIALPVGDKRVRQHRVMPPAFSNHDSNESAFFWPAEGGYNIKNFARINGTETETYLRLHAKQLVGGNGAQLYVATAWTCHVAFTPVVGLN